MAFIVPPWRRRVIIRLTAPLEPWLVEAALARLGERRLTLGEQVAVWKTPEHHRRSAGRSGGSTGDKFEADEIFESFRDAEQFVADKTH